MRKPRKEILNLYNAEYNIVLTYLGNKISITSKNAQVASPSESNCKHVNFIELYARSIICVV